MGKIYLSGGKWGDFSKCGARWGEIIPVEPSGETFSKYGTQWKEIIPLETIEEYFFYNGAN